MSEAAKTTLRTSPIFEVKAYKKGSYEIEACIPIGIDTTPTFSAFVPYWVPVSALDIDPKTERGRRDLAEFQKVGFKFSVPPGSTQEVIAFTESLTFVIDRVKTIEEAFEKLEKELDDRRQKDFQVKLKKRLDSMGPQLVKPSMADVRNFG